MTNPPEQPSEAIEQRAREIVNRHCEYTDGLGRGQVMMKTANAIEAVKEALRAAPKKGLKIVPAEPIIFEDDTEQRAATPAPVRVEHVIDHNGVVSDVEIPAPVQDDDAEKVLAKLEGYTPPETEQDWACVAAAQLIRARLSTDTALVEALTKCRDKFLHYEQLHRLKCTADGDEKADRNREMADMCNKALASRGGDK